MFDLTFLNSVFLFGLFGSLLPLLIHLLNRRRIKIIEFSTLKYLFPLQKKQMRRLRIREILLLIIRTLIIAFIALALARPALKGSFGSGVNAHTTTSVVIVLDDSFSMGYEGPDGTVFGRAREKARELITLLNESDDANLIYTSQPDTPEFDVPTHNFALLSDKITAKEVSSVAGDLVTGLNTAAQLITESINLNKEIYLITDLQKAGWDTVGTALPEFFDKDRFFIIDVGYNQTENLFVDQVDYSGQLLFASQPIRFTGVVFNNSDHPMDEQLLQLYINGIKKSQVGVTIPAASYNSAKTSVTFPDAREYTGYMELPDDGLIMDNRRYFALDIRGEVNALLVTDDPRDARQNAFYLEKALQPSEASDTRIIPTVIPVVQLGIEPLSAYQAVILANISTLTRGQISLLEQFVKDGGGLFLVLGDRIDVRFYNETLLPKFIPASIKSLRGNDQEAFFSWAQVDFDHYIFNIFDPNTDPFQPLNIYQTFEILPHGTTQTLVSYNNQMAAFMINRLGAGTVALLPTALNNEWNNLPVRTPFLPFVHRTTQFLGLGDGRGVTTLAGQPVVKIAGTIPYGAEVACIKPSGDVVRVHPEVKNNQNILRFSDTNEPGIYTWRIGSEIVGHFAVNVDPHESQLNRYSQEEVAHFFPEQNLVLLSADEPVHELVLQVRYGRELWKYFLWFAFVLLLVELLIAWSIGREKTTAPTPAMA